MDCARLRAAQRRAQGRAQSWRRELPVKSFRQDRVVERGSGGRLVSSGRGEEAGGWERNGFIPASALADEMRTAPRGKWQRGPS